MYAQLTHDVQGGEMRSNKELAMELIKRGLLNKRVMPHDIRFLEKVSVQRWAMWTLLIFT